MTYPHHSFCARVDFAARVISSGRNTTRAFDYCFECNDGDAVAVALYRRTRKRPETKLARNLWRYISRNTVVPVAWRNRHRLNLEAWSNELAAPPATVSP